MSEIYQPAEDSVLLAEFVKKEIKENNLMKVLDMGSGSGIQADVCIASGTNPRNITLADIDRRAAAILKKKFPLSKVICSDLFEKIRGKFDIIIFNPPYLPDNKFDKKADTSGGKKGSEIINKFLKDAKKYLSEKGKILLITSSFTKNIDWQDYDKELLEKKRVFFEEIYVWKLMK